MKKIKKGLITVAALSMAMFGSTMAVSAAGTEKNPIIGTNEQSVIDWVEKNDANYSGVVDQVLEQFAYTSWDISADDAAAMEKGIQEAHTMYVELKKTYTDQGAMDLAAKAAEVAKLADGDVIYLGGAKDYANADQCAVFVRYALDADQNITGIEKMLFGDGEEYTTSGVLSVDSVKYVVLDGKSLGIGQTGLFKLSSGNWYYIQNGAYVSTKTGFVKHTNGIWYYVKGGKISFGSTGFVKNSKGESIYVNAGIAKLTSTGFVKNSKGQSIYIKNGVAQLSSTGFAKNSKGQYIYIKKGVAQLSSTGFLKNSKGQYIYVKNGVAQMSTTGFAKNGKGQYIYIKKGVAQLSYTGTVTINGKKYKVVKGVRK